MAICIALFAQVAAVAQVLSNEEKGDDPGGAAQFWAQLHEDESGEIATEALPAAIQQVKLLRTATASRTKFSPAAMSVFSAGSLAGVRVGGIPVGPLPTEYTGPEIMPGPGESPMLPESVLKRMEGDLTPQIVPLSVPIQPSGWEWLGPANVGGRTRSLLIHPNNPQRMWVGGVAGGVWLSFDGGLNWAPSYDFMASMAISSMVLDPRNPETIFAGTGEGFYNADAFRGFGVFRSDDGGRSWTQLAATMNEDFRWVNRLAISHDGAVLLAATRAGLFRSEDRGQTFARVAVPANPQQPSSYANEVLDIRYHPTDDNQCVASGRGGNAFYSDDAGKTWSRAAGITPESGFAGRVELTYARANPAVVYASVDAYNGQIYRSADGGQTYVLRGAPGHLRGQGWYDNAIWAGDPLNPNLVVTGGVDLHRSTDGGQTFTPISDWRISPQSAHADQHAIVAHPGYNGQTNRTVYFCNDGGVYRAEDIGTVSARSGWQALNNGLGISQFYGAAANLDTGEIVGGLQDNGTQLYSPSGGPSGYMEIFGGDGGYSAADPSERLFYGEYIYLLLHRSKNGAASSYIHSGIADAGSNSTALFIAPFILDPNNAACMLAGGLSLWRTKDVKGFLPKWKAIKAPFSQQRISATEVATGNSDIIWVGHESNFGSGSAGGAVFMTTEGTKDNPSWTRVGAGVLPRRHCTRLTVDPANNSRVFATFGGYTEDNLWQTTDAGATWTALGSGVLPAVPMYDVAVHPGMGQTVIVATEVGLFVSDDGGQTWFPTNQGPTNCPVFELFWMNRQLVAVTHGRGIFRINLALEASEEFSSFSLPEPDAIIDP
nr:hypothetical protein [Roseovarius pacificus]